MRLTRRGLAAVAVVVCTVGLGWLSGARALNAVAAPTLAALLFGAVAVFRAPEPTVTYTAFPSGYPGETRTLALDIEGSGLVTFALSFPDGVVEDGFDAAVTPPERIERSVTLDQRGVYRLDDPIVRQRDPLGFVQRRVDVESTVSFVVYPRTYGLDDRTLKRLVTDDSAHERQAFDRLREYVPGDSLRNVHWKSSAKRDDLLVMEFTESSHSGTVTFAADATEGYADSMATATATIATATLDAGYDVALTVPTDDVPAGGGDHHRKRLLRALAGVGAGTLPKTTHDDADVSITADADGTRVRVDEREQSFEALVDGRDPVEGRR